MRVLLFDIDGTLIRSGGAGRVAMLDALSQAFTISDPRCDVEFSGRTDGFLLRQVLQQNGLEASVANLRRLIDAYLDCLPKCLRQCQGEVLPGVTELLDHVLAQPHVHVGCMTGNLAASAKMKLQHFDLWSGYFDSGPLFSGDECEQRDQMACAAAVVLGEYFGAKPFEVWVIGDTPMDVQCARAMNARVLGCCTGVHGLHEMQHANPDYLVDDLSDVSRIAEILLQT